MDGAAIGETDLLFCLSGENGFVADDAAGDPNPAGMEEIQIIENGAIGKGFSCPQFTQIFGYSAPENLCAQRGTSSFFWRARDPIGSTPFPIFQASSSDHFSIEMAWMRIDFNEEGFDGFATDASLARARLSYRTEDLPQAEQWVHPAQGWDETQGVRLSYALTGRAEPDNGTLDSPVEYIDGRYMPDERTVMVALPAGAPANPKRSHLRNALPLVHILVPFEFRRETRRPPAPPPREAGDSPEVSDTSDEFRPGGNGHLYSYTWEGRNGGLESGSCAWARTRPETIGSTG